MLCLLILSTVFTIADGRVCLPDAVPEDQRQNITMMGKSMPLGVAAGNWDSALAARDVYAILVEEILGYNAEIQPTPSTVSTLRLLAGCKDSEAEIENCSFPPIAHVGMELWGSSLQSAAMLQKLKLLGERNPEILGSMGYWGVEGMYVLGKARQRALDDAGLHLSYYGNLNASWFHPENYAANLTEVNFTNLRTCDGWTNDPLGAQQYLEATGDADGVVQEDGKTKYKCWENKWWLPPACRASPWNCMSLITGGTGWGLAELTQQISSHNMPMAFAVATDNAKWREENKKLQGFLYWWSPDSSFVAYSPALVEMPPWSLFEHKQGIYKSQIDRVELHMAVARGLDAVADRAYGLAQNLHISDSIMNELLLTMVQSATPDDEPWQTACTWLRANRIIWQEWVPDKTVCSVGRGLVDLQGEFVTARADAVDCAICPSGYASTEISETRVCSKCEPGTYQRTFGTSECNPCDLGHIAPSEGSAECEQCGLGEYANATGMSLCHRCGMGSGEEHLWTTSREIISGGGVVVIQLLGAVSQSFCACGAGTFLWDGRCQMCMEGSICPGSNRLELKPGFFSTPEAPGEVYNCFDERICPGGPPGTCSQGRDASTVACAHCQDGFQETGDRTCEPCRNSDYAFIAVVVLVVVCGVGALHITLMNETASKGSSLLVVFSSLTQFITIVQMLSVLRRFDIDWREPFASVLVLLEVLSFDVDMLSMNCVASLNSVALFGFRCLMIPMLMFIALVVHLCYLLRTRSSTFKLGKLLRTMGSIFLILFIVLWSMILAPFQCNEHPNGMLTMKRYKTVFCDGEGEHLEMFILGGLASCMPLFFLALCVWIVVMELPRRVARSDTRFLDACSFLTKRFRPGMEMASVVVLVRNAFVVMCPLVTSTAGQLMMMCIILYANLTWVAYFKPWRFPICNWLDNLLLGGMMVILMMGAISVNFLDAQAPMVIVMTFVVMMALSVLAAVCWGLYRFFHQKFLKLKQFRFFTCHQKNAAGSMARLLKMELEARMPGTKTFIDCDDLNDLTRLFSYVGQDTDTFLVLCSPAILTRKWCVGEIFTARVNQVPTLLLTWPDFTLPNATFIENYAKVVPDIAELAKYQISLAEVEETFRWLSTQQQLALPGQITPSSTATFVSQLMVMSSEQDRMPRKGVSLFGDERATDFPVLVDPLDGECIATAMVLSVLLKPRLLGTDLPLPSILQLGTEVPEQATLSLIICGNNCFKSEHVQEWLLQASRREACCVIPVIAEDAFMMPSDAFFTQLRSNSHLDEQQLQRYACVVRALFQEIAVVFVPQSYSSTQNDLELRANQAASRLTATLQPLKDKVIQLETSIRLSQEAETGKDDMANILNTQDDSTASPDGNSLAEPTDGDAPLVHEKF
ncbi:unnamed protein product [Durusdinium trenchii]|uniref:Tyrosine-protein kinase ephrin type A/B receptor-like domain-containing protein n=1 Tax=Durusdinium trenchii TaxID=1381693 RepID=A0ABP0R990_9DINO